MSDVVDLMRPEGVNLAAELAMPWCKRGRRRGRDYLEFGTGRGKSFVAFFRAAEKYGLEDMRFFGFDSFEGLPETPTCPRPKENTSKSAFVAGNYACSQEEFSNILIKNGVDMQRVTLIPGFYSQTLTESLRSELAIKAAAIVNIDCDIYESTVDVLSFVTGFLRDGSLVLFDDWLAYDAHPRRGEQRACREWLEENPQIHLTEYFKYTQTGAAFIVSILNEADQQRAPRSPHDGRRHDQRQASGTQSQWHRLGSRLRSIPRRLHA
jgi:O-methyltransferase